MPIPAETDDFLLVQRDQEQSPPPRAGITGHTYDPGDPAEWRPPETTRALGQVRSSSPAAWDRELSADEGQENDSGHDDVYENTALLRRNTIQTRMTQDSDAMRTCIYIVMLSA